MHIPTLTLLALATSASASPIQQTPSSPPQNTTLEPRTATNPAIAQLYVPPPPIPLPKTNPRTTSFYDTACTYLGQSIPVNPDNKHQSQTIGGPWGSRSAWFSSTGGLFSWTVHGRDGPRERTVKPEVAQCVSYLSGVYVTGDVRV